MFHDLMKKKQMLLKWVQLTSLRKIAFFSTTIRPSQTENALIFAEADYGKNMHRHVELIQRWADIPADQNHYGFTSLASTKQQGCG